MGYWDYNDIYNEKTVYLPKMMNMTTEHTKAFKDWN